MVVEDSQDARKILFTGLDGAGKTSIVLALRRELAKITAVEATRGAQIRAFKFLGREVREWDLGGQLSYRLSYLKNPGNYFGDTDIAIYVIDMHDTKRFAETIEYMKQVVGEFASLNIKPPLHIFLHKLDPTFIERDPAKSNELVTWIENSIGKNIQYENIHIHKSSIYDVAALIVTMSRIMVTMHSARDLIDGVLKDFAGKTKSRGCVLVDDNSLVISSYYGNDDSRNKLTFAIPHLLSLNDTIDTPSKTAKIIKDAVIFQKMGVTFILKDITIDNTVYYAILLKDDQIVVDDDYNALGNVVREMISSY